MQLDRVMYFKQVIYTENSIACFLWTTNESKNEMQELKYTETVSF